MTLYPLSPSIACQKTSVGGGVLDAPQVCAVDRLDIGSPFPSVRMEGSCPSTGDNVSPVRGVGDAAPYKLTRTSCRGEHCSPANLKIRQTTTGAHCAPLHPLLLNRESRPRRGQSGKRKKSVKKNAALLHFLGFFPLTHLLGVLRGEQPFGRGCGVAQRSKSQWGFEPHERASSAGWRPSFWPPSALPRNSGTFFASFFGHKKG